VFVPVLVHSVVANILSRLLLLAAQHRFGADSPKDRREFSRRMQQLCRAEEVIKPPSLWRGWKIGAEDFADWAWAKVGPA
jgi:hypothetical protein